MDNDSLCKRDRLKTSISIVFKITADREDVINITIVDLTEHLGLKPALRTFGAGLPRYKLECFKLANGIKAFLPVSLDKAIVIKLKDRTYVILIPRT